MAIHGTLTTMSVPDLLQFLGAGRKTGTLKFSRGKIIKQIHFEDGVIVGSTSNDPKEYLGQVLIHYGKLDEAQLQAAMEVQRNSGGKLGEILAAKGFLSQAAVLDVLRIRTLEIIYDLFLWEQAQFEFYDYQPLPEDLIRIEVQPTSVVMEGIYRVDEWARYRTLIPSDRTLLELSPGWTSSVSVSKDVRLILYFVEKHLSVAEICYQVHASAFHVYSQLCDLVSRAIVRVAGEAPESPAETENLPELPKTVSDSLRIARSDLKEDKPEKALSIIQRVLQQEPKNADAQRLLLLAEEQFVKQVYASHLSPRAVPKILLPVESLDHKQIGPQEGFLLSRINGEWDIESILSICPFREADSLRMLKTLAESGVIGF
jgi:Domain of unknown function (DUF4388)